MARIRSIHPGIWTDEAFMSLSAYARLLYIGLWGEAYDDGVFEWKPLTLKARLFPVDSVDVPELLVELYNAGLIARAEQHPKQPGLIRNFQKFQRPKKPNSSGMLEGRWRDYVGASSEPVPNQSGTGTGKPPQMEDGGGNSSSEPSGSDAPSAVDAREVLWRDGLSILKAISGKTDSGARQLLGKWLKASRDDCALVMSKILAARDNRVGEPISWITAALSPPDKPPPKAGVVGALHRIIESENNGSESIFGDHRHVELLPAASGDGQRNPPQNLLGGPEGRVFAGRH
jgi:hypothetical protein